MRHFSRRRSAAVAVSALGSLLVVAIALAAPPVLDTTFGDGGTRVLAGSGEYAYSAVPTASGGVLAVGSNGSSSQLARLTASGAPDAAFGTGGRLVVDLDPGTDALRDVAVLGGDLVAGGRGGQDSIVVRFDADGSRDTTFGAGGALRVDLGGLDYVRDVAVDGSGRIVAGAYRNGGGAVLRILGNGVLDTTFGGGDGIVPVGFDVAAVHALAGGATLVAGSSGGAAPDLVVAKLDAAGALDSGFGSAGLASVDAGGADTATALAIDDGGAIVVAGWSDAPTGIEVAVARLLPGGAPDPAFSGDGVVRLSLGGDAIGNDVAVLPEGGLVVVGGDQAAERAFVLTLGADGSFDPADVVKTDLSDDLDGYESAFVTTDGLTAVGSAKEQFAFARYALDTGGGGAGSGGAGDVTAPVLAIPADVVVDAVSRGGATVTFAVSASDDVDPAPTVRCDPTSGSTFAIGLTTVRCVATDASGNTADGSLTVRVRGADEQLARLRAGVGDVDPWQLRRSLLNRLDVVEADLRRGHGRAACALLRTFAIAADRRITGPAGDALAADARRIAAVLGC